MSEEKGQNRGWLWAGGVLAWKLARSVARPVACVLMGKRIHRAGEIEGTRGAEEPRRVSDAVMLGLEATALTQALRDTFEEIHEQEPEESSERDNDRNVDAERGVNVEEREKWGTALIVFWLVLSFAAGIAFLFTYWTGGNNLILGGTLGVFFGCFGIALIVWSHSLIPHTEAIEPRQPLAAPTPEFQSAMGDFTRGYHQIRRRNLLKWASVAGAGMLAAVFISFLRSMGHPPDSLYTRVWNQGQRLMKFDGTPVTVDALQPGSTMIVFPEGSEDTETAQTVLLRVRPELLRLPASRSTWAPNGYLAYSRVCTHAGCTVGMYERTSHLLMCPCHQSTFDVLIGAQPTGGPAARPLPQLPLYADDRGFLRAGGGFTEPPGPGFWGMP
jgi:ubiquinol-cytochrome c reductase iron-sulfur subunit